jgi:hypothetical protein
MGYKCEIKGVHGKRDRTGPRSKVGGPAQSDRPRGVSIAVEDHVWFEDRWMVTSWCDE